MPVVIDGREPSELVRERLAAEGRPVHLAFSGGKDSTAAALALKEAGVPFVMVHLYFVPGDEPGRALPFVEDTLRYFEDFFGQRIWRYPHPGLFRQLRNFVLQPPERCALIDEMELPEIKLKDFNRMIADDLGLPPDTWVCDGIRACDSLQRRQSIRKWGPFHKPTLKAHPVWDWNVGEVRERLKADGVAMPVDYEWFGRSFDDLQPKTLVALAERAPDEYRRVLDWFPLADLQVHRAAEAERRERERKGLAA